MPDPTAVDRLYGEATEIIMALQKTPEVSLQVSAADHFRKVLLLAAASHFEASVCNVVIAFVGERANGSVLVENFVRNKAVVRQYHSWFQWDVANANQFFGLFGDDFKTLMMGRVKASEDLKISIKAFLELGSDRNQLVHRDYATFPLEKTLDEIYKLYQQARQFVDMLPAALREADPTKAVIA